MFGGGGGGGGGINWSLKLGEIPELPSTPTLNVCGLPCCCFWLAEVAFAWIYLST